MDNENYISDGYNEIFIYDIDLIKLISIILKIIIPFLLIKIK